MFTNKIANFEKGKILKKEMLESLRDFPRTFVDLYYRDYSDGVLFGCNIDVNDSNLLINTGAIKHNKKIYIIETPQTIPYSYTNKEIMVKIKFMEEIEDIDFYVNSAEILLEDDMEIKEDELELARFKLKEGAILRENYQDFFDLETEYNTLNIIHVKHSNIGRSTMNPTITSWFSKELMKKESQNMLDIAFSMQGLNEDKMAMEAMEFYVSQRLGGKLKKCTNYDVYRQFCRILKEAKGGSRLGSGGASRARKILVD